MECGIFSKLRKKGSDNCKLKRVKTTILVCKVVELFNPLYVQKPGCIQQIAKGTKMHIIGGVDMQYKDLSVVIKLET